MMVQAQKDHIATPVPSTVHDFSSKDLTAFPESIFFCLFDPTAPVIETLLLNNNKLPEIPHVLWKLPALKILNCGHNQLRYLPDTLGMVLKYYFRLPQLLIIAYHNFVY
jgi:Leucine-rich repeat (LRR) protein